MRVLFAFVGGSGHFSPLLPVAVAMRAAGHEVRFAGQRTMVPVVEAAGFPCFETRRDLSGDGQRRPLVEPDAVREELALRDSFAGPIARSRTEDLMSIGREWIPDLIVCDEADFGAMIAAGAIGVPYSVVLVMASGAFVRPDLLDEALGTLRAEFGLAPDPGMAMLHGQLAISPFPPSFRDPRFPLPDRAVSIRPAVVDQVSNDVPGWIAALEQGSRPVVYFTLGTIFNVESGDLFGRVLAGLRELDAEVVVTTGREIDPAEFGTQPAHVRIERFVPQASLLPVVDLVISHAGSGTVAGALAFGVPQVVIPLGADQLLNAGRVATLGLGEAMDAMSMTPAEVAATGRRLLADGDMRETARRFRDEVAGLPGADAVVPMLEALAQ